MFQVVTQAKQTNFTVKSESGEFLSCSRFVPLESQSDKRIVVAHGLGSAKYFFAQRFAEEFSSLGHEVVTFNYSAHGNPINGKVRMHDFSLSKSVLDLKAVISHEQKQNNKECILFGSSFGGQSIILLNQQKDFCQEHRITKIVLRGPLTDCGKEMTLSGKNSKSVKITDMIVPNTTNIEAIRGALNFPFPSGPNMLIGREAVREFQSLNPDELLSNVHLPVLIIHGTNDDVIPLKHSFRAISQLNNGKLIVLEDAGHNWSLEEVKKQNHFESLYNFIAGDINDLRLPEL